MFTIYVPTIKRSIVVGFKCLPSAEAVLKDKCPYLDFEDLAGVAFDEFQLWTKLSISIMRSALIGVWFLFFISLSALVGKFLVYQMSRQVRRPAVARFNQPDKPA
jgi:hypothetical protein